MLERVGVLGVLRTAAVALVAAAVATTFQTWTVSLEGDDLLRGHSMWTSGAGGAAWSVVLLVGTVLIAAAGAIDFREGSARLGVALLGLLSVTIAVGGLLSVRYSGADTLTAAIPSYDPDPVSTPTLTFTPPAGSAWLFVIGGAALALVVVICAAARQPAPLPPEQKTVAVGVALPLIVGVLVFVVGSIAFSWSPAVQLVSVPLWTSGTTAVIGGLLVVLGALAAVAAVVAATAPARRPVYAAAATGLSSVGLALLVAERVSAAGQQFAADRASNDLAAPPYVVTLGVVVVIVGAIKVVLTNYKYRILPKRGEV